MADYYEQTLVMPGHPVTRAITVLDPDTLPRAVYFLNDGELPSILRKPRPGDHAPMTAQLITDRETFPFGKKEQLFLAKINPNVPPASFSGLFVTWFPNGQGDTNIQEHNYVTDPNYSGPIYPYFAKLTLAGNTYMAAGAPFKRGNLWVYRLLSIDVTKPLPEVVPWYQKTYLTIWSGGNVIRFPQGNGADSFTALLSAGADLMVDARRVSEVLTPPVPYRWREQTLLEKIVQKIKDFFGV